MQSVSMILMSSSRATTAAGTSPPRVTATMPLKGPASISRQASALAGRWSSSQVTGKFVCGTLLMLSSPASRHRPIASPRRSLHQLQSQARQQAGGGAQLIEDREVVGTGDRQQRAWLVRRGAKRVEVAAVGDERGQLRRAIGEG